MAGRAGDGNLCLLGVIAGGVLGASAGVGAGTTALFTASSVAGGAVAGPVFTVISTLTFAGLELFGPLEEFEKNSCHDIIKIALSIIVGAAASFGAPTLLGFSITIGAVALVDTTIAGIVSALVCCCV